MPPRNAVQPPAIIHQRIQPIEDGPSDPKQHQRPRLRVLKMPGDARVQLTMVVHQHALLKRSRLSHEIGHHGQQRSILASNVAWKQAQPCPIGHGSSPLRLPRQARHLRIPREAGVVHPVLRTRNRLCGARASEHVLGLPSPGLHIMRFEHFDRQERNVLEGGNVLRSDPHRLQKCPIRRVVQGLPTKQRQRMIQKPFLGAFTHPRPKPRTHLRQRGPGTPILKGV